MINGLKKWIKGERQAFLALCEANNLELDYNSNRSELPILSSIFEEREYADYFPFYEAATIIDVGAHYGYFSIFAHLNTDRQSRIIAVEPSHHNFAQLRRNIRDCRIDNITTRNSALGKHIGREKLFVADHVNYSILSEYSLLGKNKDFEEVEITTLEALVLEHQLDKVDFLKLDCEGAEYSILGHTPGYIFDRINTISMEFHDLKDREHTANFLLSILVKNGFQVVKYHYSKTSRGLNHGKIIVTKLLNYLVQE